jgi:chemotaxis protein histidine kinase CheA/ActR/RegA family two-component response regulator
MTPSDAAPSTGSAKSPAVAGRLSRLGARISQIDPGCPHGFETLRNELEGLKGEAQAAGRDDLAIPLERLVLLSEVWECLASEEPGSAGPAAAFCVRALEHLASAAGQEREALNTSWILEESAASWSDYLRLIDPQSAQGRAPWDGGLTAASDDDSGSDSGTDDLDAQGEMILPKMDAATLFRMLTGNAAPIPAPCPAPSRPSKPSEPVLPVAALAREAVGRTPPAGATVEIDPEFQEAFSAEALDLFERIESLVLSLGRGGGQQTTLHELSRCFHTLKGAAGSVGLFELASRVHHLEEELEDASCTVTPELIDHLHEALAHLEGILEGLRRGPNGDSARGHGKCVAPDPTAAPSPDSPLLQAEPIHDSTAAAEAKRPSSDEPALPAEQADGPIRIPASRMDELMDLASELIARRGVWAAQAERLKEFAALIRGCRNDLQARLDRLNDLGLGRAMLRETCGVKGAVQAPRAGTVDDSDITTVMLRLAEQVEDLAVLTESAQAQALPLADDSDTLARLTLHLWETLQSIRIVPIRGLFQRLARVAHDAARIERRDVEVVMVGEETGLDRAVQDKAFEPLLHIVRNAVGHGIESPAERLAAGKAASGRVTLEARREGNTLVLSVQDDGRGLDYASIAEKARRLGLLRPDEAAGPEQLGALIFRSGFSTREEANAISGRGVGMDVVAQEVRRLRGTIDLTSQPGHGARFTLRLPARLALEQAMITRVGGQAFALPVALIEHAQPFEPGDVEGTRGQATVRIRDHRVPLIVAREALGLSATAPPSCPKLLLVHADGEALALLFDAIEGTRELVIKPLGPLLAGHPVIWGTSLSLTGDVIFIINPSRLFRWLREGRRDGVPIHEPVVRGAPVLVVDDSISVRRVVTRQLRMLGLEVEEVSNGVEALGKLAKQSYSMILTDLEMPRMDGFELLAELKRSPTLAALPVIVASTESRPATRRRALALGAHAFVAKPIDQDELARVAGALLNSDPMRVT